MFITPNLPLSVTIFCGQGCVMAVRLRQVNGEASGGEAARAMAMGDFFGEKIGRELETMGRGCFLWLIHGGTSSPSTFGCVFFNDI